MKITAMLSFFNEAPELLHESVSRVMALGVDRLLAYDGPYDLYPSDTNRSPKECFAAIHDAVGGKSWDWRRKMDWGAGNEVEKRNAMLSHALRWSEKGDWLLVFDSDHMWEMVDPEAGPLKEWLQTTSYDVAEVGFAECSIDEERPGWYQARLLNRADPGMRYDGAHWRIRFSDGKTSATLRAGARRGDKDVFDLTSVVRVRHTVYDPELAERRARQTGYYDKRDAGEGVER